MQQEIGQEQNLFAMVGIGLLVAWYSCSDKNLGLSEIKRS